MKNRTVDEQTWVRQVLNEFGSIEARQTKSVDAMMDGWPDWVFNLWPILLGVCHSGLSFKRIKKWTAKELGQFLGRQSALEGFVWDEVPLSPRVREEKKLWMNWQTRQLDPNSDFALALNLAAKEKEKWRAEFRELMKKTLASAQKRPYVESSAFFEAFGKATVIQPDELATEQKIGVGEKIAFTMIFAWRDIAKLQSVAQLHQALSSALKPLGIVVTLKRVEKLCQRIGLKYKGRGRPKGKIQTNSPVAA